MARYLSTNNLIESAKRRAMLPNAQVAFKIADFLGFANEEMDMAILPYVLSHHEDHFLTHVYIPLQSGVSRYEIPYRAIGSKLNDLTYEVDGQTYEMTRITKSEDLYYEYGPLGSTSTMLRTFYVEGNEIVLVPGLTQGSVATGRLRMSFYLRPNNLVEESRAMIVTGIDRTTGIITVDKVPSDVQVSTPVDLIKTRSPHTTIVWDQMLIAVDSINRTIQMAPANIPATFTVGDYICLAEECIIPQIPTDIHSMLAQRIACRCLEALNDQTGLAAANAKLAEMESRGSSIIDSRVESAPQKVLNRHGFLRTGRRYIRR